MAKGKSKKYSHLVCKSCGANDYIIFEERSNEIYFRFGFNEKGKAGEKGKKLLTEFACCNLKCGSRYVIDSTGEIN